VQNYLLLERAGRVTTLQNLQLLPAYANEREDVVWGMLSGIIGNARNLIDKAQDLEDRLNVFVRPLVAPLVKELGWKGAKNEPAQTQKMRTLAISLAATSEDPAVIKEGLRLFKGFDKPADLPADIRQTVYYVAVRHGTDSDFDKLLKLYKSLNNAEDKDDVASELIATRDKSKIEKLLKMITSKDVRLQDAPTWFAWLMRNRYSRDYTWQWLIDNWGWVEEKYGDDKSYDRFARYAAMALSYPDQLQAYKAFFEPKANIALDRTIKLGIEEIESRVAWRAKNEASVKKWLASQKI
jgi:aminopeptidase N